MLSNKNPDKQTKIVATVGPATFKPTILKTIIKSGVDVIRLNLSHGTLEEHAMIIKRIRRVSAETGREVGILLDLPGPKVRLGAMPEPLLIVKSHKVALVWQGKLGVIKGTVEIPTPKVIQKVIKANSVVAIDDGKVLLRVTKVFKDHALASVIAGGEIISHKGISILGVDLPLASLTVNDEKALALSPFVDFVGVSFVRQAADLTKVKAKIKKIVKGRVAPAIVAKIETMGAVKNIDSIIAASDAVMVARGDLALAVDPASLGVLQKTIVKKVRASGKPVIVATQMLDSMTLSPLPTRAEILDVANAVIDNVDAVMLSGETASGKFPREAVKLMAQIADQTEKSPYNDMALSVAGPNASSAHLFVHVLYDFIKRSGVKVIVNESADKELIGLVARHRLDVKQIVPVADANIARQLNLVWGVFSIVTKDIDSLKVNKVLRRHKLVRKGQHILYVGWHKVGKQKTAFARIERVQ